MTRTMTEPLIALSIGMGVALLSSVQGRAVAAEPVDSVGIVEARAFLDDYQAASTAQSAAFYDLYSDRALIHAHIDGKPLGMVFQGRAYKQWGRELLASHRAAPDASEFHDATVERRGSRLVVRAKRYSSVRCYWDLHYEMGIEKEGASYRIVDERLTTNPQGLCAEAGSAAVATATRVPAGVVSRGLPAARENLAWRPLSQDEIAASAMRLAQQTAARYPGQVRTATPQAVSPASTPALRAQREPSSALWVTP